jgi:hypothetical protein
LKKNKLLYYIDILANTFEIVIAGLLLLVVLVKVFEVGLAVIGFDVMFIAMGFKDILSASFSLVIGIEFTKMLYKHTPDTVIDVLLFALARQMVIYYENTTDMLVGVIAIVFLFAAKRFLIDYIKNKKQADTEVS